MKASLTKFRNFLDSYDHDRDYNVLKVRHKKAKELLSEFESVQLETENSNEDNARQLFERSYFEQIARAQEFLDAGSRNIAVTSNADIQTVLLQLSGKSRMTQALNYLP